MNGGKTNINADCKAVGQQSGIFTGDGGFDLTVDGKTDLIGGAITTTDAALAAGLNHYVSKGGITTRDIENTSSYDGDAISVGISLGMTDNKPQGNTNGLGYGSDGDSQTSTTRAGITGIAGNSGITTNNQAEYAGALENGFDATRVNEELGAQTQITQAFDQERHKIIVELNKDEQDLRDAAKAAEAVGDTKARDEYLVQADKVQQKALIFDGISSALYGPNSNGAVGYVAKAVSPQIAYKIGQAFKENDYKNRENNNTELAGEGSPKHLLAHTILGAAVSYATGNDALTGGLSAAAGEATAPLLSKYLYQTEDPSELTAEQKDTISSITSITGTVIGASTGNVTDAVNAGETAKVAVEDNDFSNIGPAFGISNEYGQSMQSLGNYCTNQGGNVTECINTHRNITQSKGFLSFIKEKHQYYNDMTILNVSAGVFGETMIVNNKNGKVYASKYFDVNTSSTVISPGASINFGSIKGGFKNADEIDRVIVGSSVSAQACYVGCGGISRTQAGDVIYTYGGGTPQVGVSGSQMQFTGVILTPEEIRRLKVR